MAKNLLTVRVPAEIEQQIEELIERSQSDKTSVVVDLLRRGLSSVNQRADAPVANNQPLTTNPQPLSPDIELAIQGYQLRHEQTRLGAIEEMLREWTQQHNRLGIAAVVDAEGQFLYLDRAIPALLDAALPQRVRSVLGEGQRIEWIHCSDLSLLPLLESTLISAFRPPHNAHLHLLRQEPEPKKSDELEVHFSKLLLTLNSRLNQIEQQLVSISPAAAVPVASATKLVEPQPETKETKPKTEPKLSQEKTELETPKGTASSDEIPLYPETTGTLAKRWGITPKTLTRQRQRYEDDPKGFFVYSLKQEEGKFGWVYDAEYQYFYAVVELPDSSTDLPAIAHSEPEPPNLPEHSLTQQDATPKSLPGPLSAQPNNLGSGS